jgi:lysophospholipase L1-like esterase
VRDLARRRAIDALVVSIGGNDIGFGEIAKSCWSIFWDCSDPSGAPNTTGALFNRKLNDFISDRLPDLVRQMSSMISTGGARGVYLTTYPDPTTGDGGQRCGDLSFTTSEYAFASNVIARLNDALRNAVATSGSFQIHIIEAPDFTGHGVCSSSPWINPVNLLQIDDSYHPNASGYSVWASAVSPLLGALPKTQP